jgi:3-phenylpropionate/cinnamic acid dioxygenase small subunit
VKALPTLTAEDRFEIQDLYARYAYTFDDADADAWSALFTPDGRFAPPGVEPVIGTTALRAFVASRSSDMPGMRHVIANVLIEADGADVRGRAYFVCYRLDGDGSFRLRNFGRYFDKLARSDGSWRFAVRDVVSELATNLVDAPFVFGPFA